MMVNQEGHMYDVSFQSCHRKAKFGENIKAARLRLIESHGIQGAKNETWPMILEFGDFLWGRLQVYHFATKYNYNLMA